MTTQTADEATQFLIQRKITALSRNFQLYVGRVPESSNQIQ